MKPIKLYHHKTDGGAEYLSDKFVTCPNGEKEGVFKNAEYIVRIDGQPELSIRNSSLKGDSCNQKSNLKHGG